MLLLIFPLCPYIADAEIDNFAPWPLIKWGEMMTGSAVPETSDEVIDGKTYSVRYYKPEKYSDLAVVPTGSVLEVSPTWILGTKLGHYCNVTESCIVCAVRGIRGCVLICRT